MTELLDIDDPLLERVAKAALKDPDAHRWLLDSARRWARVHYAQRAHSRDYAPLRFTDEDLAKLIGKQVAVVFYSATVNPLTGLNAGESKRDDYTTVGLLQNAHCDQDHYYIGLRRSRGHRDINGIFDLADLFALPPQFCTEGWPVIPPEAFAISYPGNVVAPDVVADLLRRSGADVPLASGDTVTITTTLTMT